MAEEFDPGKTSRFQVKFGNWFIDFASRRLTDILLVGILVALGIGVAFFQTMTKAIDANTMAVQAGTAETRFRLECTDSSSRYAACMMRERDAANIAQADRQCQSDTGVMRCQSDGRR